MQEWKSNTSHTIFNNLQTMTNAVIVSTLIPRPQTLVFLLNKLKFLREMTNYTFETGFV